MATNLRDVMGHLWQSSHTAGCPRAITLSHGLVIKVEPGDPERVSFGRRRVFPSRLEISLCQAHLPLPEEVAETRAELKGYNVITLSWSRDGQECAPLPEQPTLGLDLGPIVTPEGEPDLSLDEQFTRFHAANPHVYRSLVALAIPLARQGHKHLGIGMLYERLRYEYALATNGDEFKLNNNWRSRYARLMMSECPELVGLFETRQLRT